MYYFSIGRAIYTQHPLIVLSLAFTSWFFFKTAELGLPCGLVDKTLPASAGDVASVPGPEASYASGQLSPCITATEPTCLEPVLPNKKSCCHEKPSDCSESSPCSPPHRKPACNSKDQAQPKLGEKHKIKTAQNCCMVKVWAAKKYYY